LLSPRKGFGVAVVTALAILAPSVAAASAAITHSSASIDAPFGFYDETVVTPPARTVTATTDGTGGDTADVLCLHGSSGSQTLASGVTIQPDGSISTPIDESKIEGTYCRIVVVDAGSGPPADSSPFQGPYIGGGDFSLSSDGSIYDFYAEQAQTGAYADFKSLGGGGMYDMALQDSVGGQGPEIYYYNGYFESGETHPDGNGGSRPDALVDGKHAYTANEANDANTGNAGRPAITVDHAVDPATGDMTLHEAEDLVLCAPSEATCTSYVPSGLRVERTIALNHDGRVADITDTIRNTDSVDHSFDFEYQEFHNFSGNTGFRLPGETGYSAHPTGDVVTGLGLASTVGIEYDTTSPDTGVGNPLGAITFSPAPTRLLFGKQHDGTDAVASGFWVGFKDTVPAGGSKTINQDFAMGETQAEVDGYVGPAEDSLAGPAVAITDPAADGSTVSTAPVTVKGTASDNKGVASLKVNGADVSIAGDGTWSAPVTLSEGANTITAVAKDAAGNSATATRTITYTKPAPPLVVFATVTKNGKVKVTRKGKKILVDTGIKVTCPQTKDSCTAATTAKTVKAVAAKVHKSKITVAKKTFTIAAGKTQKIVLTLSAKGVKALKRNKKLVIKVTVVTKVGSGPSKTTTRTITIKQPKAKKH
jgi:hypothetical protein